MGVSVAGLLLAKAGAPNKINAPVQKKIAAREKLLFLTISDNLQLSFFRSTGKSRSKSDAPAAANGQFVISSSEVDAGIRFRILRALRPMPDYCQST